MLSARTFTGKDEATIDDPDQISEAIKQPDNLVWVDVQDPTDEDYDWIEREFSLHPLAMRDARKHGQRPKLDIYKTHSFLVTYSSLDNSAANLPEVDLFVGPDWLISVRNCNEKGEWFDSSKVLERFRRTHHDEIDGDEVGFLLYSMLDEIVIGYFDSVDQIEDRLEELETVIFEAAERSETTLQQELLGLRRELLEFRRKVVPLRDVVQSILREEVPWVDDHNLLYFQDVLSHLLRVADQIDTQRELIGNAVDAHLATVANKMNVIMKKMTSWGAILICATIVTGVYGMNFPNIPLLNDDYGYPISLLLMAAITIFGYAWFRKKDWL